LSAIAIGLDGDVYGIIHDLMTPLKPLSNAKMLIPYEQFYIQSLHQAGKLISEQYPSEPNPLFQLAIYPPDTLQSRASRATSLDPDAYTHSHAPDQQPAITKGMYILS
jgi:hypothetical protein